CSGDATCVATLTGVASCLTGTGANDCGAGVPSVKTIASGISLGATSIANCLNGLGFSPCSGNPSIATIAALLITGVDQAPAGQAAPGSHQLATGLGQADTGSGKITGGLGQAKGGGSQIEQGVYAINELGVKEVGRSANDTAITIGQALGMLQAQDQRAQADSLMYPPPSSDQAKAVVGGSGVVLVMDELDARVPDSVRRNIYVGIA